MLGTAGLPHILMRFFTVPNAKAARGSVMWAMFLIGAFYVMTTALGFGAARSSASRRGGGRRDGNFAVPARRELGGELLLAIIAGVAFATILAVVAGLVISASGAVAHDVVEHRPPRPGLRARGGLGRQDRRRLDRRDRDRDRHHRRRGPEHLVHGRPRVRRAASANFPALLLALTWRRFNTTGAVTGVLFGVISSIALVVISPTVWPGPDSEGGALSWYSLANPGSSASRSGSRLLARHDAVERAAAEAKFDELYVRSETGLGAEHATGLTGGGGRRRTAVAAATATIPRL